MRGWTRWKKEAIFLRYPRSITAEGKLQLVGMNEEGTSTDGYAKRSSALRCPESPSTIKDVSDGMRILRQSLVLYRFGPYLWGAGEARWNSALGTTFVFELCMICVIGSLWICDNNSDITRWLLAPTRP